MSQDDAPGFDLSAEMAEDASHQMVSNDQLKSISALADRQVHLEQEVQQLEAQLKQKQEELRQVAERDLPTKMDEVGMKEFTLSDGRKVSIKEELKASIPKHRKNDAADWLLQYGLGSLVKEQVAVNFEAGEDDKVQTVVNQLREQGFPATVAKDMNTNSVKSALKELRGQGVDVPMELFGAYDLRQSKIQQKG
jgi:uncharacterized small protein (DUF1192 family)